MLGDRLLDLPLGRAGELMHLGAGLVELEGRHGRDAAVRSHLLVLVARFGIVSCLWWRSALDGRGGVKNREKSEPVKSQTSKHKQAINVIMLTHSLCTPRGTGV